MSPIDFQTHVIESLARLETQMTALVGNGQPGRVSKLETSVEALKRDRWIVGGAVTAFTAITSVLLRFIIK